MTAPRGGRIITFYSYKGGTGRTMALANVAWILAAQGERVLVVDWDLEAPGLHRFFLPFMNDPDLRESDGLVDMVSEYVDALGKQSEAGQVGSGLLSLADPRRHAVALQFDFEGEGCLHLLAAGRQDQQYAERVRGLDWQQFYISFGGEAFIEHLAAIMRQQYDYVLIDSRTGVADSAGICTMQMPDQVVLCFTYNRQSVEGAAAVAKSIGSFSRSKDRTIKLLPLPTRVIPDIEGIDDAREFALEALTPHLPHFQDREDLLELWSSAEVRHYPAYGFEETLASFRERPGGRNNLLADMEWLTGQICGSAEPRRLTRMPSKIRERYLHRFRLRDPRRAALDEALANDPTSAFLQVRSLVSKSAHEFPQDRKWAAALADALQNIANRLSDTGRLDEALNADKEAVIVRRQLAALSSSTFEPDLGRALHNLALRLDAVGQRQEALATGQEAVAIFRELAARSPDGYRPGLASSLNNLSIRLKEVGQRRESTALAQEAVAIFRELAARSPNTYLSELAVALNNLAIRLSEVGRHEEALAPAQEAVAIRRELAEKAHDPYRPALALALNNLANHFGEVGQREGALGAAQEAADLYRELANAAPGEFRSDLAMALNSLATSLNQVGRAHEALKPAQEAAAIYRELADKAPEAYLPDLASSLANLANHLSAVGHREQALGCAQEAADIYREVAARVPDAYQPDLASALNNLAIRLSEVGQRQGARQAAEDAIRALTPGFLTLPAAFAQRMGAMVQNYQKRCEEIDSEPDAELLTPILRVLQRVEDRSDGEEAEDGQPSA